MVFSKWGDQPHWESDCLRLGEDALGVWLGMAPGTVMTRPGASFSTNRMQVMLIPPGRPFVATFHELGSSAPCAVYVDITTAPVWDGDTVRAIDLDLDVVKGWTGRVWVDDEDEFADHRVRFGYPPAIVRLAVESCEQVQKAVAAGRAPYDGGSASRWLDELARVSLQAEVGVPSDDHPRDAR